MRKQCVSGPLLALWEGPGYKARDWYYLAVLSVNYGTSTVINPRAHARGGLL